MRAFLDSSALVKRYADEPGAEAVRALDHAVVSALAQVEVPAAIWRKHRDGGLSREDAALLADHFRFELESGAVMSTIGVGAEVLGLAAAFPERHGLRAYDAVQLASALLSARADPGLAFGCDDHVLRRAAIREGLTALPL